MSKYTHSLHIAIVIVYKLLQRNVHKNMKRSIHINPNPQLPRMDDNKQ